MRCKVNLRGPYESSVQSSHVIYQHPLESAVQNGVVKGSRSNEVANSKQSNTLPKDDKHRTQG